VSEPALSQEIDLSAQELRLLNDFLKKTQGFSLISFRNTLVRRRILTHMHYLGVSSVQAYLELLKKNPKEIARLISKLSIKVSSFFRNRGLFDFLARNILPRYEGRQKPLEIVCIGSAGGQEPYSLALLLKQQKQPVKARILAIEWDEAAVVQARKGLFAAKELHALSPRLASKNFLKKGDHWQIKSEVAKMVDFQCFNIFQKPHLPKADIIFCRNLLIFYTREKQIELLVFLKKHLRKEGFLVLGKSETLLGKRKDGLETFSLTERVYQKIS